MKQNKLPLGEMLTLISGEALVALLVIGGYILYDVFSSFEFTFRVVSGALLGVLVTVLNYLFLTISVNRAVNDYLEARGTKEMDEEEAGRFASEHSMPIQNAIKTSFLLRTATMLVTLVAAFLLDWFEPLATVIPLLAFRPLLMLADTVSKRRGAKSEACAEVADGENDINKKECD